MLQSRAGNIESADASSSSLALGSLDLRPCLLCRLAFEAKKARARVIPAAKVRLRAPPRLQRALQRAWPCPCIAEELPPSHAMRTCPVLLPPSSWPLVCAGSHFDSLSAVPRRASPAPTALRREPAHLPVGTSLTLQPHQGCPAQNCARALAPCNETCELVR